MNGLHGIIFSYEKRTDQGNHLLYGEEVFGKDRPF